jgi:hypothetical protein
MDTFTIEPDAVQRAFQRFQAFVAVQGENPLVAGEPLSLFFEALGLEAPAYAEIRRLIAEELGGGAGLPTGFPEAIRGGLLAGVALGLAMAQERQLAR